MSRGNRTYAISTFTITMMILSGCATLQSNKVTSVVDPTQVDGIQELAAWKHHSATVTRIAPSSCEAKYTAAKEQLNSWIEGPLMTEIDNTSSQYYGAVDLRKAHIPASVSAAVGEFQTCAGSVEERGAEDIGRAIVEWAVQQARAQRKQSADALKVQLRTYEWANWSEVRNG